MRRELIELLAEAGIVGAEALHWDNILVVRSSGSLINPLRPVDRNLPDRGFHFLIAKAGTTPDYYCKARPALPGPLRHRETLVLEAFAADARSRPFVPAVWSSANERIELQVTRFMLSDPLDRFLTRHDRNTQASYLGEVLDAGASLSLAALDRPDIFPGAGEAMPLGHLADDVLDTLPGLGVPADLVGAIRDLFDAAGSVPGVPQHGDFWPQNVLRTREGGWCVVDLDNFGDVIAPIYDATHMLRTFDDVSGGGRSPWISRMATPAYATARALLRREMQRWELTPAQLGGCVLLYLADIAVRVFRRGAPEMFWGRFRDELPAALDEVRRTGSISGFGAKLTAE